MELNNIIIFLQKNKSLIRNKYKADVQGVFGSYSRGEQGEESDLDILVRFDKDASLFTWGGLVNYLQEQLGIKVDVVSERALREELKSYIEKDLVRV